jgi:dTDP-4-amino-4,6-dideoxygalactose transaminase
MSNVCAGIGRGQMINLDNFVIKRRNTFEVYKAHLSKLGIKFPGEPSPNFANRWLTTIIFESPVIRDKIMNSLALENIESRPLWKPLHLQPVYSSSPFYGKTLSAGLFENGLCLPSGSSLTEGEQSKIIDQIIKNL